MELVILSIMALYLIISLTVVLLAARAAKKKGKSPWRWSAIAAVAMYLLVFWDQIPTILVHKYYCETKAGFWVYKTVEQWKMENPGVVETLDRKLELKLYDPRRNNRFWSTQQFYSDVSRSPEFHAISREEKVFVDAITQQPLARSINFWRGHSGNVFAMGGSLDDFRQALVLGWGNRECRKPSPTDQMAQYRHEFELLGDKK